LSKSAKRTTYSIVAEFIDTLDNIGFTCDNYEDVGHKADVLFSDDDYENLQIYFRERSLDEKVRKHT